MHHNQSGPGHRPCVSIVSRQGDEQAMDLALEAQKLVRHAAGGTSGLTVKGQIRQAAINLGYSADSWRIREAWYLRAGCWSAQAIADLQARYLAWREREAGRASHETFLRAQRDVALLEKARAEHIATLTRIERQLAACKAALRVPGPDEARP